VHLVAAVTLQPQPNGGRSFDVLVNAPPDITQAGPGSPFFAGRIAFFGPQRHAHAGATFLVPLTQPQPGSDPNLIAPLSRGLQSGGPIRIAVVPAQGSGPAPVVSAISVRSL